jgi:hypothetical protein
VHKRFGTVRQPHQKVSIGAGLQYFTLNLNHIGVRQGIPSVYLLAAKNKPGAAHRAVKFSRSGDRGSRQSHRCGCQQGALHGASPH